MKNKKIITLLLVAILIIAVLPINAFAKSITELNAEADGDRIAVSGSTEEGVLAIAVLVYAGDDLVYMETASCSDALFFKELDHSFEPGDYTIKVADYEGGNYMVKDITIGAPEEQEDTNKDDKIADTDIANTNDATNILLWVLLLFVAGAVITETYRFKKGYKVS